MSLARRVQAPAVKEYMQPRCAHASTVASAQQAAQPSVAARTCFACHKQLPRATQEGVTDPLCTECWLCKRVKRAVKQHVKSGLPLQYCASAVHSAIARRRAREAPETRQRLKLWFDDAEPHELAFELLGVNALSEAGPFAIDAPACTAAKHGVAVRARSAGTSASAGTDAPQGDAPANEQGLVSRSDVVAKCTMTGIVRGFSGWYLHLDGMPVRQPLLIIEFEVHTVRH